MGKCTAPLPGYRSLLKNENGKRPVIFKPNQASYGELIEVACGRCMDCRLERSRQWAMRCVHEASLYDRNCFITLTYRDSALPPGGSLRMKDFQDFMKRLRKRFGNGIRFFHCGEYGAKNSRPHYHALLFNHSFDDLTLAPIKQREIPVYCSTALEELWPHGFSTVGEATFETAAYVARYVTKKIFGEQAQLDHYGGNYEITTKLVEGIPVETKTLRLARDPEYITMSRRPGIGKGWFDDHSSEVFPDDQVVLRGRTMRPPKYYDRVFALAHPSDFATVRRKRECDRVKRRKDAAASHVPRIDLDRMKCGVDPLAVREAITLSRFKQLKRGYENGETENVLDL